MADKKQKVYVSRTQAGTPGFFTGGGLVLALTAAEAALPFDALAVIATRFDLELITNNHDHNEKGTA